MKSKRICSNGHTYFKTSNCPVCPICVQELKPTANFLAALSAPARRVLESKGITTLQQLSLFSKKEILSLHGIGPASIPILSNALYKAGMSFKK
ncbi:MAG: hypothetical protein WAT20_10155 [Ferruginibacter sp.]|nr:hypothetical protein [Chitinophagaceae bacterium]